MLLGRRILLNSTTTTQQRGREWIEGQVEKWEEKVRGRGKWKEEFLMCFSNQYNINKYWKMS